MALLYGAALPGSAAAGPLSSVDAVERLPVTGVAGSASTDTGAAALLQSARAPRQVDAETVVERDTSLSSDLLATLQGEAGADSGSGSGPFIATSVEQRWWLGSGDSDVGVGVGATLLSGAPMHGLSTGRGDDASALVALVPAWSVGLRYRVSSAARLVATATRQRLEPSAGADDDGGVSARVGVEWKPARRTPLGLDKGNLRFQLRSGSLMSLKIRKGSIGLQLRSQF